MVTATAVNHSPRSNPLCGQNHILVQGCMASPLHHKGIKALINSVLPEGEDNLVLTSQTSPVSGSTTGPTLVGIHRPNHTITSPSVTMNSQHHYHFRCLQHRFGSMLGGHNYWGNVVSTGDDAPYQLSGAPSCVPSCVSSSAMLSESR